MRCVDCDALVIGGGIVGCFTALRLSQRKLKVCLAEKDSLFKQASGRSGGGVRQQGRHPAELPLAMESVKIWRQLAAELGHDIEYHQNGSLRLNCDDPAQQESIVRAAKEKALGLEVHLLSERQIRHRLTGLGEQFRIRGGTFCPSDGTANPLLLGRALAHALKRAAVEVHSGEKITALECTGGRVAGACGTRHSYRCAFVVNAAGAWANTLCQSVGIDFPIVFRKAQLLVTEPISPLIREFVLFDKGYVRQALAGNFHLGIRGEQITHLETNQPRSTFEVIARHFPALFPFLANLQIIRGFAGITNWTPDGIPIIDRAPGIDGFWLASGFSGHGFCLGPLVGQLLCEWIVEGRPKLDLSAFAWSRFKLEAEKIQKTRIG